jgi:hypothetical protein
MPNIYPPGVGTKLSIDAGDSPFSLSGFPRPNQDYRVARGEEVMQAEGKRINVALKSNSVNFQEVAEFAEAYGEFPTHTILLQRTERNPIAIASDSIVEIHSFLKQAGLTYQLKTIGGVMMYSIYSESDESSEFHQLIPKDSEYREDLEKVFPNFSSICCYSPKDGILSKEILYVIKELKLVIRLVFDDFTGHAMFISGGEPDAVALTSELLHRLTLIFEKHEKPHNASGASFYMITADNSGLDCVEYEFDIKKYLAHPIEEMYNDDFPEVSDQIIKKLKKKNSMGVVLLHGDYGSGKTSYLRYLISKLSKDKRVIYFPPDLAHKIGDPAFLNFIRNYRNSVLVIEDAENVIMTREAGGNQAVSNLLNLSDGIMGDALSIQLVCTFNSDESFIDAALLRPGRLIAKYNFKALSEAKTLNLVEKLYGPGTIPDKSEMTLAEIFNMRDMPVNKVEEKPGFGFSSGMTKK